MDIGVLAGRIQTITEAFEAARTAAARDDVLAEAGNSGLQVQQAAPGQPVEAAVSRRDIPSAIRGLLSIDPFHNPATIFQTGGSATLPVSVGEHGFLLFRMPPSLAEQGIFSAIVTGLGLILIPAVILAFICAWMIGRPLVRFAAAAERVSMDDGLDEPFRAEGAAEIRSLAASLNTMRRRVLDLAGQRTRMLTSISHDLRTPLTRLRMRTERCEPQELRDQMLKDIEMLASMIDDSLAYLSNTLEARRKVELSSLLQTLTDDFADTGANVTFNGPRRLTYECKPRSISRAVSNLIDNASRVATKIDVTLATEADGTVVITVADDGPGLSDQLKGQVLEPFFKADESRPLVKGSGFGLGLPIAHGIITIGHGGTFELLDRSTGGLAVIMRLPGVPTDKLTTTFM
ncbi:ATP-binding protein [Rhizobium sp. NPDC090279]|uniref:ATP-binding protein n=1 Tax=Rhizobium sp. NPDC090279 TaxID=3364499 RepID=UPI003839DA4E